MYNMEMLIILGYVIFDLLIEKLTLELNIKNPKNQVEFLKTLLKDYILLTR